LEFDVPFQHNYGYIKDKAFRLELLSWTIKVALYLAR